MKLWIVLISAAVFIAGLASCGGGGGEGGGGGDKGGVVGTYVDRDNEKNYIEIRSDETYLLFNDFTGSKKTGIWSWGDEEKRSICLEGTLLCLTIRGETLVDSFGGDVYLKE